MYGGWPSSMHVPNFGTKFLFFGNSYMIIKFDINDDNIGLFILSHVFIRPKQLVTLMPFCGPFFSQSDYLNIVKHKHNISIYTMCIMLLETLIRKI